LNPKLYDIEQTKKRPPSSDKEVMNGFITSIKKTYGLDLEEASLV